MSILTNLPTVKENAKLRLDNILKIGTTKSCKLLWIEKELDGNAHNFFENTFPGCLRLQSMRTRILFARKYRRRTCIPENKKQLFYLS
jgi:hypothetical protein